MLKILYFGIYSKGIEYPRNNNLIKALRLNGAEITECHYRLAESFSQRITIFKGFKNAFQFLIGLLISHLDLIRQFLITPKVDAIIVGHPGYFHVHLASILRFLFQPRATLVYDAFIPLFEMIVDDRKLIKAGSPAARLIRLIEKSTLYLADMILVDTHAHQDYLANEYHVNPEKFIRAFVGSTVRENDFKNPSASQPFSVLFVGTYIPLHGIDIIVQAAKELSHDATIRFILAGRGQLRNDIEMMVKKWRLSNIIFQDWIQTDRLSETIASSDLCLGIFGTTPKTTRVIPSKIYDICAVGAPFITADTPAIREVFCHLKNAYLIPAGDPKALAEAIRVLKSTHHLRNQLSKGAGIVGRINFSLKTIGSQLNLSIKAIHGNPK
ncbi:MAG: glycosyltransferase [Proteobacteria bacterium]|nr:glycosyltransferase [Pseudomonadota bacterium]